MKSHLTLLIFVFMVVDVYSQDGKFYIYIFFFFWEVKTENISKNLGDIIFTFLITLQYIRT